MFPGDELALRGVERTLLAFVPLGHALRPDIDKVCIGIACRIGLTAKPV